MLYGQVDELLVVCVTACHVGFGGDIDKAGVLVKFGEDVICA